VGALVAGWAPGRLLAALVRILSRVRRAAARTSLAVALAQRRWATGSTLDGDAQGDRRVGVPQPLCHDMDRYPGEEQRCGVHVPQVVEASVWQWPGQDA